MKTNIPGKTSHLRREIRKDLDTLRRHVSRLDEAFNDPEVDKRGIGIGFVTNAQEPLERIKIMVAEFDALTSVRVYE